MKSEKERPIIGYCIVNTPDNFSILDKEGTKLYKAIAEYVDILIINDQLLITDLDNDYENDNHEIYSLESIKPKEFFLHLLIKQQLIQIGNYVLYILIILHGNNLLYMLKVRKNKKKLIEFQQKWI